MRLKNHLCACLLLTAGSLVAATISFSPALPATWSKKVEQVIPGEGNHGGNVIGYENSAQRESLLITVQPDPGEPPAKFEENMKLWKQGVLDGQIHSRPTWKPQNVQFGIVDHKGEKQAEFSYQVTLATNQTRADVLFFYYRAYLRDKKFVTILATGRDTDPKTDPELKKLMDGVVVK